MSGFALYPHVAGPGTRAVGYLLRSVRDQAGRAEVVEVSARMWAEAKRWDWDMDRLWIDDAGAGRMGAQAPEFVFMLAALRERQVGVVLVADMETLGGCDPVARWAMVRRIEATGAVVAELPRRQWRDFGLRWQWWRR